MLITKVELKNIKNHAEAVFEFRPGVVAICGPNGAGKTTILEAIAWALFDHLDYKRDDFVKRGAKRGIVSVTFRSDLDGRDYIVTRDTAGAYQVYDPLTKGRLVEQKNQVVPWLEQHIGVEPGADLATIFKTTIGVPQGTFTFDFTLAPTQRKNVFDQILKVEEYRRASDNLRDTLRHIEGRIIDADKALAEAEGELKIYDTTKREHGEVEARLQSLEAEQHATIAERERLAADVERLNGLYQRLEAQRALLERLRVKLEFNRDSLATAVEAAQQARAAAATIARVRGGYDRHQAATAQLAEFERQRAARDRLRERASTIERHLIEAISSGKRVAERLDEIAEARQTLAGLAEAVTRQASLDQAIAELREGRGQLQSLRRAQEALEADLGRLRARYGTLAKQVETAQTHEAEARRVEALEAERARLDEAISQTEVAARSLKLKSAYLTTLQQEAERLGAELGRNRDEQARLAPLAATAAALSEIETRQQSETDQLAHLRAGLDRDREMIRSLDQGGICPLLTEKCLNLKRGESLDTRFRTGLLEREAQVERLQAELATLAGKLQQSRAAAVETSRLPFIHAELARLAHESEAKRAHAAELESELALSAGDDLAALKTARGRLEMELRAAREAQRLFQQAEVWRGEIDEVKKEGEVKRAQDDELKARLAGLGDIEANLSAAEIELTALGDPRGRATALAVTIAREPDALREQVELTQRTTEVETSLNGVKLELKAYAALDALMAEAAAVRGASEGDYYAFIQNEQTAATVAGREQEAATIASEIEQTETALAAAATEAGALESAYDPRGHNFALAELDRLRQRAVQLASTVGHTREQFDRLSAELTRLEAVREKLRAHLMAREQAQTLRQTADFIRDILLKAAPFITESYVFAISLEANHLYREITGRHDVTLRWTKEYEIVLEEEGRERPFLNLSGGEQMAAALAVRLALLKELSEINIAFFDEPTTNMDEERRHNLAQQIGRIKDFHQLFVISHDDSFEGYTDQIVMLGEPATTA